MKKYWKKIVIFIIVLLIVLLTVLFIGKNHLRGDEIPYKDIRYYIPPVDSYCSCLNLSGDNKFFEYDCDSEPSNMPFSGEVYDKYYYNKRKNIIIFKGDGRKNVKAQVLKWTEDEFKIKVLNSSRQCTICSSNGKDIYTYYKSSDSMKGKEIKNLITKNNFHFSVWDGNTKYYNFYDKENDICGNCETSSTDFMINKIKDNKKYFVKYIRNKNGKLVYLDIIPDY